MKFFFFFFFFFFLKQDTISVGDIGLVMHPTHEQAKIPMAKVVTYDKNIICYESEISNVRALGVVHMDTTLDINAKPKELSNTAGYLPVSLFKPLIKYNLSISAKHKQSLIAAYAREALHKRSKQANKVNNFFYFTLHICINYLNKLTKLIISFTLL